MNETELKERTEGCAAHVLKRLDAMTETRSAHLPRRNRKSDIQNPK